MNKTQMRTEADSYGPIDVPADALWGAQTARSLQFFNIGSQRMPIEIIHALAWVPGSGRLLASTNNDVNVSVDEGDTWQPLQLRQALPLPYFRGLAQHGGLPEVLLLGTGDAPPGTTGLVARSLGGGAHAVA